MSDSESLFEEILGAPDRDHCPGATPVVSFREDDEAEFLDAISARARTRVSLERRGVFHGDLAEVEAGELVADMGMPLDAVMSQRWHTARPILLPGMIDVAGFDDLIGTRQRLHAELKEPNGLRDFLTSRAEHFEPSFTVQGRPARMGTDKRDIEKVGINWKLHEESSSSPRMKDLWVKSGWLSDRDDDESLRMRVSFGREVDDDASRDVRKHRRVTELVEAILPEAALLHNDQALSATVDNLVGSPTFFTQHIAYWNAPGGGALFHHDAFAEESTGGQKGVCFVQMSGSTAWLALSVEDLTRRVIEFLGFLEDGELSWVKRQVFKGREDFEQVLRWAKRFKRLEKEVSKPGCGVLSALVNCGPEFTSFLADAGHAYVLHPGDALLLPNHGYSRTAMHSVFSASEAPGYALSMAIREIDPPEIEPPEEP